MDGVESRDVIAGVPDERPNLALLGFGVWSAWISLCYYSPEVTAFLPSGDSMVYALAMYVVSTLAIAVCMFVMAVNWRLFTPLLDKRAVIVAFGLLAGVSTALLAVSGSADSIVAFLCFALLTGIGTSVLCMKVGRIFGSIALSESLPAAGISLVLSAMLYFVGTGVPDWLGLPFISLLPVLAALLLSLPVHDPFPAVIQGASEAMALHAGPRKGYRKCVAMLAWVAFTAGIGWGIASMSLDTAQFAEDGAIATFFTGLLALALVVASSNGVSGRRAGRAYVLLMLLGIVIMLFTCIGLPLGYLVVGKDTLWLFLTCLVAYMAFKFGFSSTRAFGIAQGLYFLASTAGWVAGAALAPFYEHDDVALVVGVVLAAVTLVALFVLYTESDVCRLVDESFLVSADEAPATAVVGVPQAHVLVVDEEQTRVGEPGAFMADDFSRAREARYGLSARELEVLELFAQGRSANWIADHLVISKNTVRTHLRNSYAKLDVHSRQELLDFLAGP